VLLLLLLLLLPLLWLLLLLLPARLPLLLLLGLHPGRSRLAVSVLRLGLLPCRPRVVPSGLPEVVLQVDQVSDNLIKGALYLVWLHRCPELPLEAIKEVAHLEDLQLPQLWAEVDMQELVLLCILHYPLPRPLLQCFEFVQCLLRGDGV